MYITLYMKKIKNIREPYGKRTKRYELLIHPRIYDHLQKHNTFQGERQHELNRLFSKGYRTFSINDTVPETSRRKKRFSASLTLDHVEIFEKLLHEHKDYNLTSDKNQPNAKTYIIERILFKGMKSR